MTKNYYQPPSFSGKGVKLLKAAILSFALVSMPQFIMAETSKSQAVEQAGRGFRRGLYERHDVAVVERRLLHDGDGGAGGPGGVGERCLQRVGLILRVAQEEAHEDGTPALGGLGGEVVPEVLEQRGQRLGIGAACSGGEDAKVIHRSKLRVIMDGYVVQ